MGGSEEPFFVASKTLVNRFVCPAVVISIVDLLGDSNEDMGTSAVPLSFSPTITSAFMVVLPTMDAAFARRTPSTISYVAAPPTTPSVAIAATVAAAGVSAAAAS